jgi:CubicO group peptidase (beta-lactamase class C family)
MVSTASDYVRFAEMLLNGDWATYQLRIVFRNCRWRYTRKLRLKPAIASTPCTTRSPMKTDAIFRIASMTKPFTSVATMMLVEEGKILLSDPVSVYLAEFKSLQVGVEKISATGNPVLSLEPARSEATIQDLMRHTSGLTYGFFGKSLVKQAYLDANLFDPNQTLAELVSKLSKLPLAYQPRTTWDYGMSTDVLGRVVEVVSGVSLDQFIADRIVKPLGLPGTGFYVTEEKAGRIAQPQVDSATGKRPPPVPSWSPIPQITDGFDAARQPFRVVPAPDSCTAAFCVQLVVIWCRVYRSCRLVNGQAQPV